MHHIRPFESSDAPAVAAIAATAPQIAQWSADAYAQLPSSGYMAWVAVNDAAERIGFIVIRVISPEAEILNLAVAPALREAGIGSDLLAAALRHALRIGREAPLSGSPPLQHPSYLLLSKTLIYVNGRPSQLLPAPRRSRPPNVPSPLKNTHRYSPSKLSSYLTPQFRGVSSEDVTPSWTTRATRTIHMPQILKLQISRT